MAKVRRDKKGFVLRKGEYQRSQDGMYTYAYTDLTGKRRVIYAKTLTELRKKEDDLTKDKFDGIDSYIAGNVTINYLFDRYMSTKTGLRKNTRSNYQYVYNRYIRDGFGKRKIREIHYSDIMKFYLHLLHEVGLQVNTVDSVHTLLHPVFQMAVRDEIIRKNPTDGVMAEIKKNEGKNKGIRHALQKDQQTAFLRYVAESPVYSDWLPLFMFLFGTGCRIGETIGIRWEDIDIEKRTISVNHNVTYRPDYDKGGKCEFYVSLPKTESGIREIPMVDELFEILQEEYNRQDEEGISALEVGGMTGFVFINNYGSLHHPSTINKAIERIRTTYNAEEEVKAAKAHREPVMIPHFSCHQIRHTFCTRLCETESNLKVIQEIMGHKDIQTTMDIYAEATEQSKKEAVAKLSGSVKIF